MYDAYSRMELLLGQAGVDRLSRAKIAVFGLGGAGSYVVEALARCGVGSLTLIDHDVVSSSNINRQLFALQSTIGRKKVQIAKERIRDIDEDILVHTYETFYNEDTAGMFDLRAYDYIVDTIDTMPSKILLIEQAAANHTPIISCLSTCGRLNPSRFEITDISKTSVCPAAKAMRAELRKKGIRKVKVLYSKERPRRLLGIRGRTEADENPAAGSVAFVPSVAGMLIAGEVVRDLLTEKIKK
ncbi:MAG TPA: tRNA threonylcarbamoyladenosine dehydratase [Candidatus Blautia faecipullorum]|nr:tRNA threonylcarbamoyladenosine dehydratase [Candidatus Blautia faecipullorum]